MLSIPKNPLADVFGRMIFVGVPTPAPAPAKDCDDDESLEDRISPTEIGQLRRTIGNRLREAREELCRLKIKDAAVLLDVPESTLKKFESA